jgi:WhiB family redox-sensing transcriptional regulator
VEFGRPNNRDREGSASVESPHNTHSIILVDFAGSKKPEFGYKKKTRYKVIDNHPSCATDTTDSMDDWRNQASCKGMGPSSFYPKYLDGGGRAAKICSNCPVEQLCLGHALNQKENDGIWGGHNMRFLHLRQKGRLVRKLKASGLMAVMIQPF